MTRVDVLVIGAGAAGIAASVGAARRGASVALVEASGMPGGIATHSMVGTICGLYERGASPRWANEGFPREFAAAVGGEPVVAGAGLWFLPCTAWQFRSATSRVLGSARTARLCLESRVIAAARDADGFRVRTAAGRGLDEFVAKALVDATGEAAVLSMAGCATNDLRGIMSDAFVVELGGWDASLPAEQARLSLLRSVARDVDSGELPHATRGLVLVPMGPGRDTLHCKVPMPADTSLLPEALVDRLLQSWRRLGPQFRSLDVRAAAATPGRRLVAAAVGNATVTDEMARAARPHPEGIARGCWPMERWDADGVQSLELLPEGHGYEIPLGSLEARDARGIFVAGRCVSATPGALASARVMGTCLATGWAAGCAAAALDGTISRGTLVRTIRDDLGMP